MKWIIFRVFCNEESELSNYIYSRLQDLFFEDLLFINRKNFGGFSEQQNGKLWRIQRRRAHTPAISQHTPRIFYMFDFVIFKLIYEVEYAKCTPQPGIKLQHAPKNGLDPALENTANSYEGGNPIFAYAYPLIQGGVRHKFRAVYLQKVAAKNSQTAKN